MGVFLLDVDVDFDRCWGKPRRVELLAKARLDEKRLRGKMPQQIPESEDAKGTLFDSALKSNEIAFTLISLPI